MTERDHGSEESRTRSSRRLVAATLTVLLAGAALLWWIAGSNTTMARWISLGVIIVALTGWHLSRDKGSDR